MDLLQQARNPRRRREVRRVVRLQRDAQARFARRQGHRLDRGHGICHSYTPDGRCVSLLKILLTNYCIYDCLYCVNRVSSNMPRARFSVEEVVQLTLDFYRRNYIEGLFLSSGIIRDPDYTMEQVVEVARVAARRARFRGYIHLKTIPDASDELIARAGRYADRLSASTSSCRPSRASRGSRRRRTSAASASRWRACACTSTSAQDEAQRAAQAAAPSRPPGRARR